MADARYDAVILGGGHHGTIIAPYLARAGLSVGVFEASGNLGGGARSMKGPTDGFTMNVCSHWTRFYSHPAYADLDLQSEGLQYRFPEGNEAMAFEDGTAFVGWSAYRVVDDRGTQEPWPEGIERTERSIRQFSNADADTYLRLHDAYEDEIKRAFGRHRYTVPPPWGEPDPLEALMGEGEVLEPVHQFMSVRQLAADFFVSPEMQTLFMRAASTSYGAYPDDVVGLQGLVHVLGLTLSFEPAAIAVGGSQSITDALVSAGRRRGAEYHTHAEVDRILHDGTRANGVRLVDGSTVAADLVVSDLGMPQNVLRLLRGLDVHPRIRRRLENIHFDRGQLVWANLAVHEPPAYNQPPDGSELGPQPRLYWGRKDPDYLMTRYQADIMRTGRAQHLYGLTSTDSLWDETRAPDGMHLVAFEEFTAPNRLFDRGEWRRIQDELQTAILEQWQLYAPNMTRDNVAAMRISLPRTVEGMHPDMQEGGYSQGSTIASQLGRFRPIPELSDYHVLLDNVYCCSSSMHSSSGIGRGNSLNCWRVIASDLGIDPNAVVREPDAPATTRESARA